VSVIEVVKPVVPAELHFRAARRLPRGLARPVALWQRRRAILLLVARDLKVRYGSSSLGYLWSVLEPLMTALIYWFVFTQVFTRKGGAEPYIVFLLAGLLPWTWFNGGVNDAARSMNTESKLIRSTNLPREVWVLRVVIAKGVEYLLSLPVLFLFAICYSMPFRWQILYLVPAVLLQTVLVFGIGLLLAPLVALISDLERVVRIALRLGMYFSPVLFTVAQVPAPWNIAFGVNPLAGILELCRASFFPEPVNWLQVGWSLVFSLLLLVAGWCVFARLERTVLKEI
jgi:ABC-2 type transport system permease protein